MSIRIVAFVAATSVLILSACEKQSPGFGLEGSPIRYTTQKFEDPEVLAEVNGQKFTKGQILDKSPVLKDLEAQENEARIGLAYLKIADRMSGERATGSVEIHLPRAQAELGQILARFGREPVPGLGVIYKAGESSDVIATYKDIKVSPDEIADGNIVLQSIAQRRYQEIASQLNGQMARILINDQASTQKRNLQEFLEKDVLKGQDTKISDAEVFEYTAKIGLSKDEVTEELKPRFQEALKLRKHQELMEEYVAKNILKGPVAVSFGPPDAKLPLDETFRPVAGYRDAPVTLVAFSGATCPDCTQFIEGLADVLKKYDGHLKLNWIHNFNSDDGIAKMMAEGALCVDAVKPGKTVDFLAAFAKTQGQTDENAFYDWAAKNGIDEEAVRKCFVERRTENVLAQHLTYAKKVGIVANPTLWVEGRTVQGVISEEQLEKLVGDTVKTKGSSGFSAFIRRIKAYFTKG